MFETYDVIVVGAGHAGCEAATAVAHMGKRVLLITMNMNTIAQMSCNPAMGGVAKGQIVREIDALCGYSGIVTDETMIQFRMLNKSKGPAMWSPRAQSDRMTFALKWRALLESEPLIDFWQEMVTGLIIEGKSVVGVKTQLGIEVRARAVILTNGTFLNGVIHIGEKQFGGGRAAERAAVGLTAALESLGFESGRMKTGTPPRVDGRSLNWEAMELQAGDEHPGKFSYLPTTPLTDQIPCHITYTSAAVHEKLKTGFSRSPMFNGRIKAQGPRYCPSIEDKIDRFADRDRHQLFIEPEGRDTCEVYVNGFSSSLPEEVQFDALRLIPGFEKVKMFRPGYAIEYDFFQPTQLHASLETKLIDGLYFAGQINGTTGYEEAASQGLMAGINAVLKIDEKEPFVLKRSEAYIGVLIDDLVNKGTEEPYRMFTSRAEFRILLRQDNADIRLSPLAQKLGLKGSEARMELVQKKQKDIASVSKFASNYSVNPADLNPYLTSIGSTPMKQKMKLKSILTRPHVALDALRSYLPELDTFLNAIPAEAIEASEIEIKYAGYMHKEQEMADKMNRLEEVKLHEQFNYSDLNALSAEAREKLDKIKPMTIGQASRISGVSPADISVLLVHLGR